jgi:flagellar biosynthesis/type III secretory pathway protein FliH
MLTKRIDEWEKALIEKGIEQGIEKGIEQGIEKGIEQGIEKGIEQGIEKGHRRLLVQQVAVRFGDDVAVRVEAHLESATQEQLERIGCWVVTCADSTEFLRRLSEIAAR